MNKKRAIAILLFLVLFPLWMWVAWKLTPKRRLTAAIIDKTVLDTKGQEHISLDWVLNQQRFTKNSRSLYDPRQDYFGFFPGKDERFRLKGLERFSSEGLQRLASDIDLAYFTDTYGIYRQEWYPSAASAQRSGLLYGGMSGQDILLLREMKARRKLIIAEFNTIGSPTPDGIRDSFEQLFQIRWTGWTARYFSSLDTGTNKELPRWLIGQYCDQHGHSWPFHREGIAWVHQSGKIEITEDSTDLSSPEPEIEATAEGREKLGLPERTPYPFWFDVIEPDSSRVVNQPMARFVIHVNTRGAALLGRSHIPASFPAVLHHGGPDYRFYYFSGDFCDNPLSFYTSYFKGAGLFGSLFYDSQDPADRKGFFWNFYRPMMTHILEEEYRHIHH